MSDLPPNHTDDPGVGTGPEREAGPTAQRAGHIDVSSGASEPTMDPANRSLIEAMRITYRLLMVGMVALAGVYLLSGFQPIDEGQKGVRTLFGKIDATSLDSGIQFAFPPPFGEIIKVPTGAETVTIDQAFFPALREDDRTKTIEQLANARQGSTSLNPTTDGAMITADGNLAHARWAVTFRRESPTDLISSIDEQQVNLLLRAAVSRAIVRVIAEVPIDDLLKQSAGQAGSVVNRVRDLAQRSLDEVSVDGRPGVGIRIERVDLLDKTPPLNLYNDFAAVQSAQSEANQRVETARSEAETELNRVAGRAADPLVRLIDRYERAIEVGDSDAESETLAKILAVLSGESVEIASDQGTVQLAEGYVSGEVTRILAEARSQADALVTSARSDDASFRARLVQLEENPLVAKQRAWADSFSALIGREEIQTLVVPPGTALVEVLLNQDPQLRRQRERAQKLKEIQDANEQRRREFRLERGALRASQQEVDQ